jgi:glycosyltransferase involved in cell wall biosynthesis
MRVMYLNPSGQLGGAETSLLEILASLREAQPSWRLHLLTAGEGPLAARAAALGVSTAVLPFAPSFARLGESGAVSAGRRWGFMMQVAFAAVPIAAYLGRLRAAIREFAPDVLHTNGLKMHLLGSRVRRRPKLVWHLHDYLGPRPMSAKLLRWNRSRCSAILANSASVAADVRTAMRDEVKVYVVHNAVDLDRFSPSGDRLNLDELAGLPRASPDTVRIGLLGTFARWKGQVTFLDAVHRVPHHVPIRAYLIGGAVYDTEGSQYSRAELMQVVDRLGIGDRVGFTGFVADPAAALRALDIVVHASTSPEPFGLVIVEAMACERPVVVSLAGGAAEIVTPGVDALGHAPGDVDGLAARLIELALDPALRTRIAREGRATAERCFDRARLARQLVPIYESVVALAPGLQPPASSLQES